jgi:hypothetical protein
VIRISVHFDIREHSLAKEEARALGISLAEFVRRSLRDKLPVTKEQPWMRYAGMVASGDPNSSQHIDDIVYGSKD